MNIDQWTRIERRITSMVLNHEFFAMLVVKHQFKMLTPVEALDITTAATDGTFLYYNPEFIAGLSDREISGLLVHEGWHCGLGHIWRIQPEWNRTVANWAADYEVNGMIADYNQSWVREHPGESEPFPLPKGALVNTEYPLDTWVFEMIYHDLMSKLPPPPPGRGKPGEGEPSDGDEEGEGEGEGGGTPGDKDQDDGKGKTPGKGDGDDVGHTPWGEFLPAPKPGDLKNEDGTPAKVMTRDDWDAAVATAEQTAKLMGTLPGCLERLLGKLRSPELAWFEYLYRYFDEHCQDDFNPRVPDRRFLEDDIYLPSLDGESMGTLAILLDTSGSVWYERDLFDRFVSELGDIINRVRPERTIVLHCDTSIHKVQEFSPGDPVEIEPKGGGGTDFRPVFDWLSENDVQPRVLVAFTDGFGRYPDHAPEYDVLWVDYGNYEKYPFGDVIRTKPRKQTH